MTNSKLLKKELTLRKLFAQLAVREGYQRDLFCPDLFNFFDAQKNFSFSGIKALWKNRLKRTKGRMGEFSLYVHIPFCRKRCNYCRYFKSVFRNASHLDGYVQSVIQEMRMFKGIFKGILFNSINFGGGTPSLLSDRQLIIVFKAIYRSFKFGKGADRNFELNPYDASKTKLKILADYGINRLTFGVQSLDKDVLRHVNRGYQDYAMIKKVFQEAKKFPSLERINADLLVGLWNDTPKTILDSFSKLAELGFDSICVYPLVPTSQYLRQYFHNDRDSFDRQRADKFRGFARAVLPVVKKFGYSFCPLTEPIPWRESWDFVLKNRVSGHEKKFPVFDAAPQNILGIGLDSWSQIAQTFCYKNENVTAFLPRKDRGRGGYQGVFLNDQRDKLWYVLQQLAGRNQLAVSPYKDRFGTEVRADFQEPLTKLQELGVLSVTPEIISLRARSPEEKFSYLLFFVDHQKISGELKNMHANAWFFELHLRGKRLGWQS